MPSRCYANQRGWTEICPNRANLGTLKVVLGGTSENGIYGHSRFCNTDFDDKLACLNLSGV
ncbi:hypothetical protein F8R48_00725 [Klebsiella pneumoniae subsp. pneumoniae]|nr:hypothetical protein [Klebsiella pneumoniae subsp. pneumoniae]MQT24108.1 hypothetical protein [Klebsiella pneumoniae subsp. pneumoniae]